MTCGVTRPVILLPCAALTWDVSRMRVVLLHELAHIRRRDCLMHCVAQAALALHWCNPLMWMALARLRAERERACDDLVLVAGTRGSDYAEHLLDIARQFRRQGMEVAAVAMARPSELEGRLLAILDPLREPSARRSQRVSAGRSWQLPSSWLPVSGLRLQARAAVPDVATRSPRRRRPHPRRARRRRPLPRPRRRPRRHRARSAAPVVAGVTGGVTGGVRGGVAGGVDTDGDSDQDDAKLDPVADAARDNAVKALAARAEGRERRGPRAGDAGACRRCDRRWRSIRWWRR